jgi:hypothetical protein
MPCRGSSCKTCELEKCQALKEVNTIRQTLYAKHVDGACIANTVFDDPFRYNTCKIVKLPPVAIIPSSPIYLVNLSFLLYVLPGALDGQHMSIRATGTLTAHGPEKCLDTPCKGRIRLC